VEVMETNGEDEDIPRKEVSLTPAESLTAYTACQILNVINISKAQTIKSICFLVKSNIAYNNTL